MKSIRLQSFFDEQGASYQRFFFTVLFSYVFIYFIFLYQTHFLPYVFDNNETFSSLIHAQNLFHFGVKNTFGLTDEAYGFLKAAHPFVYTHQGNFPRFYAFLLYAMGIRSAEGHIFITTFTVGLVGLSFCYHFFAKYVSSLFALIFCLLLMTDYIMFMQWQVNTWRVWHLFFFFSSFLCCYGLVRGRSLHLALLSILNFACLFYMEIAYAFFVLSSVSIYLLLFAKLSLKRKVFNLFIFSSGALLGMSILVGQNIIYLGWSDFLKDLSYTYAARDHSIINPIEIVRVIDFYSDHHLMFFNNFGDEQQSRNLLLIMKGFYHYCLNPYSLFVTLSASIVILGTSAGILQKIIAHNLNGISNIYPRNHIAWMSLFFLLSMFFLYAPYFYSTSVKNGTGKVLLSFFALILSFVMATVVNHLLYVVSQGNDQSGSNASDNRWSGKNSDLLEFISRYYPIVMTLYVLLSSLVFLAVISYSSILGANKILLLFYFMALMMLIVIFYTYGQVQHVKKEIVYTKGIMLVFYGLFSISLGYIFFSLNQSGGNISQLLQEQTTEALGGRAQFLFVLGVLFIVSCPLFYISPEKQDNQEERAFKNLWPFMLSTALGFICVSLVFSGYVRTGYLVRYCCFTVFAHMTIYAWLFYVLTRRVLDICAPNFMAMPSAKRVFSARESLRSGLSLFLLFIFIFLWINTQQAYIREFPPNKLEVLSVLKKHPFYRQPVITHTYAAPFSYAIHTWAYFDPAFANFNPMLDKLLPQWLSGWTEGLDLSWAKYVFISQLNRVEIPMRIHPLGDRARMFCPLHVDRDLRYLWFADAAENERYQKPKYFVCWQPSYSLEDIGRLKPRCSDLPLMQFVRTSMGQALGFKELAHDKSGRDKWAVVSLEDNYL